MKKEILGRLKKEGILKVLRENGFFEIVEKRVLRIFCFFKL